MFRNYFKTAWRNIIKSKAHSLINIAGLSVGMAVAMLIGLWIWNELSFNKYHENYHSIAEVMENDTYNGVIQTSGVIPLPLDNELRKDYGSDFKHIVMSSWTEQHVLSVGDKNISYPGNFMGSEAPEMFTLHMLKGTRDGLKGRSSMLISQSVAKALFGNKDPINQLIKFDDKISFKVYDWISVKPKNRDESWACIWAQMNEESKGKKDSVYINENWMFNKEGKIAFIEQLGQTLK